MLFGDGGIVHAMPDSHGKLTAEDQEKVMAWVARHPSSDQAACPICGGIDWVVADHLVLPVTWNAGQKAQAGGVGYPQVMLISTPCGYTRFVNAVYVGLLPAAQSSTPERAET